jgi:hypothetical protein
MLKHLLALTFLFLLVVSFPAGATNASSASRKVRRAISGRITDPNGTVVVTAQITIVGRSSHTTVVKNSDAKGQYVVDLEPDTYDVTAGSPGFRTVTRSTRVLRGSRSYMDFVLDPAAIVNSPRIVP